MLTPEILTRPLDFDLSLNDFFDGFLRYKTTIATEKIEYEYNQIKLREPIGARLSAQILFYYPLLAREVRKFGQLYYKTSIDLTLFDTWKEKGLAAITDCLHAIDEMLSSARLEKAALDARMNNLIYLFGQTRSLPVLQQIKPYFHRNGYSHNLYGTRTWRLTVSGVHYWINYRTRRFGEISPLYLTSEYDLLADYFEKTGKDSNAISQCALTRFAGGILNTPIYAFLVRNDHRHKGKKHYVDLADNTTFTRIADVREKAVAYTKKFEPWLIEE